MKKLFNIIPLIFMFHISNGQEQTVKEYLDFYFFKCPKDSAKFYRMAIYDKDSIEHGKMQIFYMSGKLYSNMEYFHGIKCNDWTWFHESGQKMEEGLYDNNEYYIKNAWLPDGIQCVKDGTGFYQSFYRIKTKQLNCKGKYIIGIKDSLWSYWFDNGNLEEISLYKNAAVEVNELRDYQGNVMVKNGNGSLVTYYSPGTEHLWSKGAYKDGKREGEWLWYHKNGKIDQIANYKNGNMEGSQIIYFPNGNKYYEGNYVADKVSGKSSWWYWTGQIKEEGTYDEGEYTISNSWNINGEPMVVNGTGPYEAFYNNGIKSSSGYYKNGTKVNKWVWYFRNGKKAEEGEYIDGVYKIVNSWKENGDQEIINGNGRYTEFFLSGGQKVDGEYINGKREGEWKWYFNTGQIEELANYRNGELHGMNKEWSIEGNKTYEANIDFDKNSTKKSYYYNSGSIKEEGISEDGKYSTINFWGKDGKQLVINGKGIYKDYFDNGKVEISGSIIKGRKNGIWKWWYESGQLYKVQNYKNGLASGKAMEFYENGKLSYKGAFKNGKWDGPYTLYDEEGGKSSTGNYKNGVLDGLKCYISEGKKTSEEFYKDGKIIYSIVKYFEDGEPLYYILSDLPKPTQGFISMNKTLDQKVKKNYEEDITASKDGIIHVNMVILKNGDAFQPWISKGSIDAIYDEKALELVKSYADKWTPGKFQGKPVYTLVHVPILLRKSDKLKNSFDVTLLQDGKEQNGVNNVMVLDKKPFELKIRFPQPNNNEVEVLATFDSTIYKKALEGIPMLQILEGATGMAEDLGNTDHSIIISPSGSSFWFYTDSSNNRFNKFVINEKEVICNREIDSVMVINDGEKTNLKEKERKNIPLSMIKQKNLYLIFFTRKNYYSDIYYYDYHRQCLQIQFKD